MLVQELRHRHHDLDAELARLPRAGAAPLDAARDIAWALTATAPSAMGARRRRIARLVDVAESLLDPVPATRSSLPPVTAGDRATDPAPGGAPGWSGPGADPAGVHGTPRPTLSWATPMSVPGDAERARAWLLWGTGSLTTSLDATLRSRGRAIVERELGFASTDLRTNALVVLGCSKVLSSYPGLPEADLLLDRCIRAMPRPRADDRWPWPEPELGDIAAVVPDALMSAGVRRSDVSLVGAGLRLLRWLVTHERSAARLRLPSARPLGVVDPPTPDDSEEQEVAVLTAACARAYRITGDPHWARCANRAVSWFDLPLRDAPAVPVTVFAPVVARHEASRARLVGRGDRSPRRTSAPSPR